MSKKEKFIIPGLIILTLIIIIGIIAIKGFKSEPANNQSNVQKQTESPPNFNDYKAGVKEQFDNYIRPVLKSIKLIEGESNINDQQVMVDNLIQAEQKIVDLKVPAGSQEFHLKLVIMINNLKNYLQLDDLTAKESALDKIKITLNDLKTNYNWLEI